jgi:hypothetical protein
LYSGNISTSEVGTFGQAFNGIAEVFFVATGVFESDFLTDLIEIHEVSVIDKAIIKIVFVNIA